MPRIPETEKISHKQRGYIRGYDDGYWRAREPVPKGEHPDYYKGYDDGVRSAHEQLDREAAEEEYREQRKLETSFELPHERESVAKY